MNKLLRYVLFGCVILMTASCKKYLDINDNPNLPTKAPINGLLLKTTENVALNVYRVSNITSYYVQYLASPNTSSPTDTYDEIDASNTWTNLYDNMTDVYDMQKLAEEAGATQYTGVAKILTAMDLIQVHDLWGSGPFTEAFTGEIITPAYEDAESIYQTIITLLNDGIDLVQQTGSTIELDASSDLIHGGEVDAWVKTAHALKARMLNRLSKTSQYDAGAVLAEVDAAYQSAGDDAAITTFDVRNPWNQAARDNLSALLDGWLSDHIINAMNGTTYGIFDPRIEHITDKTKYGDYRGTRNGKGRTGSGVSNEETYINTTGYYSTDDAPLYIITYEEVKFIEAEAALRSDDRPRAYAAYIEGITANMNKMGVSAADRDAYINDPSVSVGESNLTLDLIFKEKYKALFLSPETWSDARRYDYQYKDFEMPLNAVLGTFVRRLMYPSVETSRNSANVPAVSGNDEKLWWDQ